MSRVPRDSTNIVVQLESFEDSSAWPHMYSLCNVIVVSCWTSMPFYRQHWQGAQRCPAVLAYAPCWLSSDIAEGGAGAIARLLLSLEIVHAI